MKLRSLCTAALVAGVLVASTGGAAQAFAAPGELDSTGTVTVDEGGTNGKDKTPDPEKPDEKLPEHPEIPTNPDAGALIIDQVSNLSFGNISTDSKEIKKYAAAIDLSKATPAGTGTRGAIVGWTDVRGGATVGYTVTAELTQQFTGSATNATTLANSTITYSNGMAVPDGANKNTVPSNVLNGFELAYQGGAKTVVTADKANKEGKGTYVLEFGQSADYKPGTGAPAGAPGTDAKSVELTVPATTASNMVLDTYTAKVTWKIVAAA
ncbi:WxL domain-containing protein [Enterococcus crotali]|uniref:WxL domain-containing protein n=1 Tax=Enterococcus crotali TaxID=1453587 RepID=UPI000471C228|nr:WxL domain-containing protein [Enterococcus crotali]